MRLSLPALQRLALRGPNGTEIHEWTRLIEQNIARRVERKSFPKFFKPSGTGRPSQWPARLTFVNASACDGARLRTHPHASVFAFEHKRRPKRDTKLLVQQFDVHVAHFTEQRSIAQEVADARRSKKKAVAYVVPAHWTPVYGLSFFEIPVVAVTTLPPEFQRLELTLDEASPRSLQPLEWTVAGFTGDAIIVGDSRQTPESTARFLELARVFKRLTRLGWKPLRTIHFVSFPRYSAPHWSRLPGLSQKALAYVDCGVVNMPQRNQVSSSASTARLAAWAADQLVGAGLVTPPHVEQTGVYSSSLGSSAFLLNYQIPSIAAALDPAVGHVQFLALVVATLCQDPILPLTASGYDSYVGDVSAATRRFDSAIEDLRFNFTREYPWYQGVAKLSTILQRKRANLIMSGIESLFAVERGAKRDAKRAEERHDGKVYFGGGGEAHHLLYSIDTPGTQIVLNTNRTQIDSVAPAVRDALAAFA